MSIFNRRPFILRDIKDKISIIIPDKLYLSILFRYHMGYWLDWKNLRTFNEKLQWLKLYNQNPLYTKLVDKFEVKKIVADIIGNEFIIPTIALYNSADEIDFDQLPSKFVLKCTHDSGSIIVCKDKAVFDKKAAITILNRSLRRNHFWFWREWPYKNVKPRIIAEEFVEDQNDGELRDYKFYCFNGRPYSLLLATDRLNKDSCLCFDYYDMNFNHLDLTNHWHPNAKVIPHKPIHFEEMKKLAEKLSFNIPVVRVDFYEANGRVYFGEMTFFDMGGFLKIHPDDWDMEWGSMITLPKKDNENSICS